MGRKTSKRSPDPDATVAWVPWKFTKCMNARDLSRDDDYLSHLFIEKISGICTAPLLVHRMNPERLLPKTNTQAVFDIIQRVTHARQNWPLAVKLGVNSLFEIPSVLYFIKDYEQRQINAFATHASRYLELYLPNGSIEIAQTSRYSRITGKNELCILATRPMPTGFLIAELKGSMAELTEEEDKDLRNPGGGVDGGRRDFSVIHSKQLKKNHLFLGPARFVNHDCDNNCELFRDGRYITFRTIKPIAMGQELTAHYGEGYFGKNNRHCLCETCERRGKGGFSPQVEDNAQSSTHDDENAASDNDSDSDTTSVVSTEFADKEEMNVNERRTRRGVYRIVQNESDDSEEDEEEESVIDLLLSSDKDHMNGLDISQSPLSKSELTRCDTLNSKPSLLLKRKGRPLNEQSASTDSSSLSEKASFKSVITTRGQKAREASMSSSLSQCRSPSAISERSGSSNFTLHLRSRTLETSASAPPGPKPRGRPRKYPLPEGTTTFQVKEEASVDKMPSARSRSSLTAKAVTPGVATVQKAALQQKSVPSVPTCITCLNPLSPEDIEEPELAPTKGRSKGKANAKVIEKECQRCTRHFSIWGVLWPQRIAASGSRDSSTRENTPSDSADSFALTSVPVHDLKLRAARLSQLKRIKEMEQEAKAKAELAAAANAPRVLKRKRRDIQQDTESTDVLKRTTKRHKPVQSTDGRGTKVKLENADDVPLHEPVKKGVGVETEAMRSASANRRRSRPTAVDDADTSPAIPYMDEYGDDRRDKTFWPASELPPAGLGIKRTGLLNLRPNPNHVSRWRSSPLRAVYSSESTPTLVDDETDEATSDEHPSTPENKETASPDAVEDAERRLFSSSEERDIPPASDLDEEDYSDEKKVAASTLKGVGLISKPNPLTLAKRVRSQVPHTEDFEDPRSPTLEQSSPKKRRKSRRPSDHCKDTAVDTTVAFDHTLEAHLRCQLTESMNYGLLSDSDVSSGEEDLILPGPSNSKSYLLQKKAFSTADSLQMPVGGPPAPEIERTITTPKPHHSPKIPLTSSPSLAKILNPVLTLGPLHSEFLPSSPIPIPSPVLVDAGWDAGEESDSSAA